MADTKAEDISSDLFELSPGERASRMLHAWIKEGRFPAGRRLPSERKLADRMNVSRTSVRSAMEELQEEGLITIRPDGSRWVSEDVSVSLLDDTVAIFSDCPEGPREPRDQESTGWAHYIHLGAIQALRRDGLHSLNLESQRVLSRGPGYLISESLRGIIALRNFVRFGGAQPTLQALREAGIPVVVYGDIKMLPEFDTVTSDHAKGCYELTKWLVGRGCRRILRFWGLGGGEEDGSPDWLRRRDLGYERAMEEAGLETLPSLKLRQGSGAAKSDFEHSTRTYAGYLMEYVQEPDPVDAIMVVSDGLYFPTAAACRLLGKIPQEDILIAGYDNYWQDVVARRPEKTTPVATVDKRNIQIGRTLVELLEQRAAGELPPGPQHKSVEPELVVVEND
ncbi:MAG: GntR family transcriptional regulator [Candidatus Brocadiia bacterium]